MSELNIPESWANATFNDLISFRTGYAFKSSEFRKEGVFILRVTNINDLSGKIEKNDCRFISNIDFEKKYKNVSLEENDVLIVMVGASTGKIGIVTKNILPAALNQNMWNLKPINNCVDKRFLYYYLNSIRKDVLEGAGGSARGFIKQSDFKIRNFPTPPIKEQERIVQKIESCFAKIESTESNLNKIELLLEKYRESLLAKAFRGELVPQDPNDEPVSVLLEKIRLEQSKIARGKKADLQFAPITDDEKLFELPKNWSWISLGELESLRILSDIQDGNHGEIHPKASDYVKSGIPFVMANNITNNLLDLESCKYLKKSQADTLRIGFAKSGDILLTHKGTIGSCAIVQDVPDYIMLTPQVTYYRIGDTNVITNEFLYYVFQSPLFQNFMKSISKQATRDYVGITRQKDLIIPLPPIKEQKELIKILKEALGCFLQLKDKILQKKEKVKTLRESILKKAFEGRLVEQIPNEGTGHELLAKILSEKENSKEANSESKSKSKIKIKEKNVSANAEKVKGKKNGKK